MRPRPLARRVRRAEPDAERRDPDPRPARPTGLSFPSAFRTKVNVGSHREMSAPDCPACDQVSGDAGLPEGLGEPGGGSSGMSLGEGGTSRGVSAEQLSRALGPGAEGSAPAPAPADVSAFRGTPSGRAARARPHRETRGAGGGAGPGDSPGGEGSLGSPQVGSGQVCELLGHHALGIVVLPREACGKVAKPASPAWRSSQSSVGVAAPQSPRG